MRTALLQEGVLINDDNIKRIFHVEIRTYFSYARCGLVVETMLLMSFTVTVNANTVQDMLSLNVHVIIVNAYKHRITMTDTAAKE